MDGYIQIGLIYLQPFVPSKHDSQRSLVMFLSGDIQCSWHFCLHHDLLCNNILPYKWDVARTLFLSSLFQVIFLNPLLFVSVVFITAVLTRGTISLCYSLLWVCKDLRDVGFVIRGYRIRASHFFVSLHSIKKCLKFHDTAESPAESKNAGMINKTWFWSRGMCKIFLSSLQKFQVCICKQQYRQIIMSAQKT